MPCICHGAITGKEEYDKFIKSSRGQLVLSLLRCASDLIKDQYIRAECHPTEFYKVWIKAFEHSLLGCPENE